MTDTDEMIKNLKIINKEKSYDKMAKEIGVTTQTVYRWLNKINTPSGLARARVETYVSEHK